MPGAPLSSFWALVSVLRRLPMMLRKLTTLSTIFSEGLTKVKCCLVCVGSGLSPETARGSRGLEPIPYTLTEQGKVIMNRICYRSMIT